MTGATARRRAEQRGRWAETIAATLLRLKGYRILARRYRCAAGEIDLLAKTGATVVAVEVKTRATVHDALEAVTPAQRRRIERAAEYYFIHHTATRSPHHATTLRFDVIVIAPRHLPRHLVDAWRPSGAIM